MGKPHFKKVAIVGVGLIGGSLAINLRQKGIADEIVGVGRKKANLDKAIDLGIIDSFTHDVAEGVTGADFVFLAVPVMSVAAVLKKAVPALKKGVVVTDGGSVKGAVVDSAESLMPEGCHFVGGHPIAGTEHSGSEAALGDLYKGRWCILTPTDKTDTGAVKTVRSVWEAAGAKVTEMDAERHDRILGAISHLPHMIAYTLVNTMEDIEEGVGEGASDGAAAEDILSFSAGGFKDFTRIASSSPDMWADICAMNGSAIVDTIELFEKRLKRLRLEIESSDRKALLEDFERAKQIRDALKKD